MNLIKKIRNTHSLQKMAVDDLTGAISAKLKDADN